MFFKALFLAVFLALAASEQYPLFEQTQNGPRYYGFYPQQNYNLGPYPTPYQVPYALQYQGFPYQYQGFPSQFPGQYPFQYRGLYPYQYQGPFSYPFQGSYTYPIQVPYGNQNRFFGFPFYFNQPAAY